MLAEDAASIFSSRAGFGAEAGRPGGDTDGEFFFGNGFVAVEIVELDFGSWGEPEVGVLNLGQISGKFRQLARAGERRGVDQEGRQNFRIAVFAGVHVEEEIREGALEAGSPTFIDGEARACDFRGDGEVEDAGALADFPMWFGLEIEFRRRAPAAN